MNKLFRPIDIASLVFFRIAFGIFAFVDVLSTYLYYHLDKEAFNPTNFQFPYYGFEWVKVLPEPWMTVFLFGSMLLAIFITLGWYYRISCSLFFLAFTYLFLVEKANYLNHAYLFCWISFVMIFLPANRAASMDVRLRRVSPQHIIPYWPLFLLQFLMGVVYFFGGIAKINFDWLQAMPLQLWLPSKTSTPIIGGLLDHPMAAYVMAYGGVIFDLTVVPLLLFRQTRVWAFSLALFFHLTNALIFSIGIFPYLSLALTALFFAPDFPRKLLKSIDKKWPQLGLDNRIATPSVSTHPPFEQKPWLSGLILCLVCIHVFLPLRHHLFPTPVAWTEEGHRYAWRMMLRSKAGSGVFVVEDQATGTKVKIQPRDYLSFKQERKMYTHPDMILQFAHFLQREYEAKGQQVAIYADIQVKLNDHPRQRFVDPTVDLTTIKWQFFQSADWILPVEF